MEHFEEYKKQGEPEKSQKAENWGVAIGLQQVDNTQRKTKCKARKVTIIFIKFRHFCQRPCRAHYIYVKL